MKILGIILVALGLIEFISGRAFILGYKEVFPKKEENMSMFLTSVSLKIIVGVSLIFFE